MHKTFNHNPIVLPKLKQVNVPGLRYYEEEETQEKAKFISITTLISHNTKHKFVDWRKQKGEQEANRITNRSTTRGTKTHSLIESYVRNEELPTIDDLFPDESKIQKVLNPEETVDNYKNIPYYLFENLKPELDKIDNIIGLEIPMFSRYFGIAGTSDCIADYNGKLSIIDYKTSEYIKREEWIFDYFVQAVAYRYMLAELTGLEAEQLVILMAAENGQIKPFVKTDFEPYTKRLVQYIDQYIYDKGQELGNQIGTRKRV